MAGETEDGVHDWRGYVAGVVLAGGRSRRMGGADKALADLGGETLLERVTARLGAQASPLVVSAGADPARLGATSLPVVADMPGAPAGPLSGLLAAMDWVSANAPEARYIASAPVDTPFLPADMVARFIGAAGYDLEAVALAKSGERVHPVCGLWPLSLADDLRAWLGEGEQRAVRAWTDRHTVVEVIFPGFTVSGEVLDPFFNVNTPDELEVARAVVAEMAE